MSIWEEIQKGRNRMLNTKGKTLEEQMAPDLDQSCFYGEADALEDEVLFPEESSTEPSNALYSGTVNALENFGNEGPNLVRFVHDLETDEELESNESNGSNWSDVSDGHLLENENQSDEDEWKDESEDDEEREVALENAKPSNNGEDDLATVKSDSPTMEEILSSVFSAEQQKDMAVLHLWKPPRDLRADFKADFDTFYDREKSRRKPSLHRLCSQLLISNSLQGRLARSRPGSRRTGKMGRSPGHREADEKFYWDLR